MPRLILLTGTRGAGKRSIAEVLVATRGFVHENEVGVGPERNLADLLLDAHAAAADAVVTWTDTPDESAVRLARHLGYEWVEIRRLPAARASATEPRIVAALDQSGSPRTLGAILGELG